MFSLRPRLALAVLLAAPAVAGAADTYKVDASHSAVVFKVKHMNTSNAYGRFNDIAGTFALDDANPAATALDITVKADSVDTANEKRPASQGSRLLQYPPVSHDRLQEQDRQEGGHEVSGHRRSDPARRDKARRGHDRADRQGQGSPGW